MKEKKIRGWEDLFMEIGSVFAEEDAIIRSIASVQLGIRTTVSLQLDIRTDSASKLLSSDKQRGA